MSIRVLTRGAMGKLTDVSWTCFKCWTDNEKRFLADGKFSSIWPTKFLYINSRYFIVLARKKRIFWECSRLAMFIHVQLSRWTTMIHNDRAPLRSLSAQRKYRVFDVWHSFTSLLHLIPDITFSVSLALYLYDLNNDITNQTQTSISLLMTRLARTFHDSGLVKTPIFSISLIIINYTRNYNAQFATIWSSYSLSRLGWYLLESWLTARLKLSALYVWPNVTVSPAAPRSPHSASISTRLCPTTRATFLLRRTVTRAASDHAPSRNYCLVVRRNGNAVIGPCCPLRQSNRGYWFPYWSYVLFAVTL